MPNARTATAKDFDEAAQNHANASWIFLIISAVVVYFWSWWALIPAALWLLKVVQSISCTMQARNLRQGTYRIPNPNNGKPD